MFTACAPRSAPAAEHEVGDDEGRVPRRVGDMSCQLTPKPTTSRMRGEVGVERMMTMPPSTILPTAHPAPRGTARREGSKLTKKLTTLAQLARR